MTENILLLSRHQCRHGAGVRALIAKLSVDCRMPMEQISCLFGDIYGHPLNTATIEDVLKRAA